MKSLISAVKRTSSLWTEEQNREKVTHFQILAGLMWITSKSLLTDKSNPVIPFCSLTCQATEQNCYFDAITWHVLRATLLKHLITQNNVHCWHPLQSLVVQLCKRFTTPPTCFRATNSSTALECACTISQ